MNIWCRYRCPSCHGEKSIKHSMNASPYIFCEYCVDDSGDLTPFGHGMMMMNRVITGGIVIIERCKDRGFTPAEPPDAQREIDRMTGKRIGEE